MLPTFPRVAAQVPRPATAAVASSRLPAFLRWSLPAPAADSSSSAAAAAAATSSSAAAAFLAYLPASPSPVSPPPRPTPPAAASSSFSAESAAHSPPAAAACRSAAAAAFPSLGAATSSRSAAAAAAPPSRPSRLRCGVSDAVLSPALAGSAAAVSAAVGFSSAPAAARGELLPSCCRCLRRAGVAVSSPVAAGCHAAASAAAASAAAASAAADPPTASFPPRCCPSSFFFATSSAGASLCGPAALRLLLLPPGAQGGGFSGVGDSAAVAAAATTVRCHLRAPAAAPPAAAPPAAAPTAAAAAGSSLRPSVLLCRATLSLLLLTLPPLGPPPTNGSCRSGSNNSRRSRSCSGTTTESVDSSSCNSSSNSSSSNSSTRGTRRSSSTWRRSRGSVNDGSATRSGSSSMREFSTATAFYRNFLANRIPLAAAESAPLPSSKDDPAAEAATLALSPFERTAGAGGAGERAGAPPGPWTAAAEAAVGGDIRKKEEASFLWTTCRRVKRQHALPLEEEDSSAGPAGRSASAEAHATTEVTAAAAAAETAAAGETAAAAPAKEVQEPEAERKAFCWHVGHPAARLFASPAERATLSQQLWSSSSSNGYASNSHSSTTDAWGSSSNSSSRDSSRRTPWGSLLTQFSSVRGGIMRRSERLLRRTEVAAHAAVKAVTRPTEDFHFALLSEVTSDRALAAMRQQMLRHPDGRRVLREKPLLDAQSLDVAALRSLPPVTLGGAYIRFMDGNGLHAGVRPPVRLVESPELSYILTRYRQLHDFLHVAYGMGISVEAEVALKLVEFFQTGLPATLLAAVFGPLAAPVIRARLPANYCNPQYAPVQSAVLQIETYPSSSASCSRPSSPPSSRCSPSAALPSHVAAGPQESCALLSPQRQPRLQAQQQEDKEGPDAREREQAALSDPSLDNTAYRGGHLLSRGGGDRRQEHMEGMRASKAARADIRRGEAATTSVREEEKVEEENGARKGGEISRSSRMRIPNSKQEPFEDRKKGIPEDREQQVFLQELNRKEVLYPRHALLTELLPWAVRAGRRVRVPLHCIYVEEWLHAPLEAFREHCGVLLPPAHLEPYWR